ncbi:unnamed protein product [Angiostrongylus costaricensis]|uniref:Secreted protein n=1 Tax=Angiostrongylus costaricensis TaxID=334426 RepID=A0A0R3PYH5_ANGCS|nr:unnamed protein product [Angiostrongylus costaricensis]
MIRVDGPRLLLVSTWQLRLVCVDSGLPQRAISSDEAYSLGDARMHEYAYQTPTFAGLTARKKQATATLSPDNHSYPPSATCIKGHHRVTMPH